MSQALTDWAIQRLYIYPASGHGNYVTNLDQPATNTGTHQVIAEDPPPDFVHPVEVYEGLFLAGGVGDLDAPPLPLSIQSWSRDVPL